MSLKVKLVSSYGLLLFVLLASFFVVVPRQKVAAHPGNTSSDGGHYCWTNCDYWGYTYGTRHYHGGGYSQRSHSNYYLIAEQAKTNGRDHAEIVNRSYIETYAGNNGYNAGFADGEGNLYEEEYFSLDPDVCGEQIEYTNTPSVVYRINFQSSYEEACVEVYTAKYAKSYSNGYSAGQNVYEEEQERAYAEEAQGGRQAMITWLIAITATCLCVGIYNIFKKST